MKYAVINDVFPYTDNKIKVNMGDYYQLNAMRDIVYQSVSEECIIQLKMKDLKEYDGEDVYLPLQWGVFYPLFMEGNKIAISPQIHPLLISVHLSSEHKDEYFNEYNIHYLKKLEPIGCRDEITRDVLRGYGVESYLVGCVTHLLPKQDIFGNECLMIDVPVELSQYIPKEIMKNATCMEQQVYWNGSENELKEQINNHYNFIMKKAGLVITSRLHVASPCLAWGIPVIFAKNIIDERMSWIDKHIPLYDITEFGDINWKPKQVVYEDDKKYILDTIKLWISCRNKIDNVRKRLRVIDSYYDNRTKHRYSDFRKTLFNSFNTIVDSFIVENGLLDVLFSYSIFGLGPTGENIYSYISEKYPNGKIEYAIDNFKTGLWHDKSIVSLDKYIEITKKRGGVENNVFIATVGGGREAQEKLGDVKIYRNCFISNRYIYTI